MPVYHTRMNVPNLKGEVYGPIDGVRPQDHLITYNNLRYLRCCNTMEEVYEQVGTHRIKYCHRCYVDIRMLYRINFLRLPHHTLVHERIAYNGVVCVRCKKLIIRVKSAFECRDCIEEYLICKNRRIWEAGHRTTISQRWIEE